MKKQGIESRHLIVIEHVRYAVMIDKKAYVDDEKAWD